MYIDMYFNKNNFYTQHFRYLELKIPMLIYKYTRYSKIY